VVNAVFAAALQVTVKDGSNNPVSGATVTFTAPGSGPSTSFSGSLTANGLTDSSGVATALPLTANSPAGGYTVTASVTGAATPASFSLTNTAAAGGGSLKGTGTSVTAVNLTPEGSVDWVHWGDNSLNRKAGVSAQLSTYMEVGTGTVFNYNNDPRTISWKDGTPTAGSANNGTGVYVGGGWSGLFLHGSGGYSIADPSGPCGWV
jgi:hypothetical protein